MEHSFPKRELFEHFARVGKAMSSPARLVLLDLLAQGEKSVDTLAAQADLSVTNTSNHLKELRGAALVTVRRDAQFSFYRLADERVHNLVRTLQEVAQAQLAEVRELVQAYIETPEVLHAMGARELLVRLEAGEVVALDVRPTEEFAAGHVPGAVSIPIEALEARLPELPSGAEIVAYCRGRYCVYATEAVQLLRAHGFRAQRMDLGIPEWRALGLPVDDIRNTPGLEA